MPINPNTRFSSWISMLQAAYKTATKEIMLAAKTTVACSLAVVLVSILFSIVDLHFLRIMPGIAFMFVFLYLSKRYLARELSVEQIDQIINGDVYAIQEVNLELIITLVQNCSMVSGKAIIFRVTTVAVSVYAGIFILIYPYI